MAIATQRRAVADLVVGNGISYNVKNLCATVELATSASGTVIDFGLIPSNARILGCSRLYNDDLATSGAPTLDIGLIAVDSNITSDPDAINDGISLSAAGSDLLVVKDHANLALPAWDYANGVTADPGGSLLVRGVVKDAATNAAGTVTLDLYYVID